MQVSISKAADMVGITRATFYRHIEKKGISVGQDEDGNPKVDVSELVRIYGDRVKGEESQTAQNDNNTVVPQKTVQRRALSGNAESELLRSQLQNLELERMREREQLTGQIQQLKASLEKAQQQQEKLTGLLSEQTKNNVNNNSFMGSQKGRVKVLEKSVKELRTQNRRIIHAIQKEKAKGFWEKIFR